jgi:MFS family permease
MQPSEVIEETESRERAAEDSTAELRRSGTFRALQYRDFQLLWIGSLLSNIGTWIHSIAQGWLIRDLTASPFLIGFAGFAGAFPYLAFSLFSGVIADSFDRRRLLMAVQAVEMLCAGSLGMLVALKIITIWHVILISFVNNLAITVGAPAYQTMTLDIVGRDDLMSGVALNSTQYNLSRVIGPAIGGLMIVSVGIAGCFYINGLSFLSVIIALLMMKGAATRRAISSKRPHILRQLMEGLRYVRHRPRVTLLLMMATMTSLFGLPYLNFLPVFARDVFSADARGLSWLMASTGIGAVFSALMTAAINHRQIRGKILTVGLVTMGIALVTFSLSHNYFLALTSLTLLGGAMVSITASVNTLLQTLVTDGMRGRVMSMYALAFLGLAPVGSLIVGAVADLIGNHGRYHGVQLSLGGSGAIILLFGLYVLFFKPRVRELA